MRVLDCLHTAGAIMTADQRATTKLRVYGKWAGKPVGTPEDVTLCVETIVADRFVTGGYQCRRKRGHGPDGLYCKQHGKIKAHMDALYNKVYNR